MVKVIFRFKNVMWLTYSGTEWRYFNIFFLSIFYLLFLQYMLYVCLLDETLSVSTYSYSLFLHHFSCLLIHDSFIMRLSHTLNSVNDFNGFSINSFCSYSLFCLSFIHSKSILELMGIFFFLYIIVPLSKCNSTLGTTENVCDVIFFCVGFSLLLHSLNINKWQWWWLFLLHFLIKLCKIFFKNENEKDEEMVIHISYITTLQYAVKYL